LRWTEQVMLTSFLIFRRTTCIDPGYFDDPSLCAKEFANYAACSGSTPGCGPEYELASDCQLASGDDMDYLRSVSESCDLQIASPFTHFFVVVILLIFMGFSLVGVARLLQKRIDLLG